VAPNITVILPWQEHLCPPWGFIVNNHAAEASWRGTSPWSYSNFLPVPTAAASMPTRHLQLAVLLKATPATTTYSDRQANISRPAERVTLARMWNPLNPRHCLPSASQSGG